MRIVVFIISKFIKLGVYCQQIEKWQKLTKTRIHNQLLKTASLIIKVSHLSFKRTKYNVNICV